MSAVVLLMCAFNLAGAVYCWRPIPNLSPEAGFVLLAAMFVVIAAVSFVAIWYFWRGKNWARWLTLAFSVFAILEVFTFVPANRVEAAIIYAEALFGSWLLYWLNTWRVKVFFTRGSFPATR